MDSKTEINKDLLDYLTYEKTIINNSFLSEEQKITAVNAMKENFALASEKKSNAVDYLTNRTNSSSSSSPHTPTSSSNSTNINITTAPSTTLASSTSQTMTIADNPFDRQLSPVRNRSNSALRGLINKFSNSKSDGSEENQQALRMSRSGNSIVSISSENKRMLRELRFAESVPVDKQVMAQLYVKAKSTLIKKDEKTSKLESLNSNQLLLIMPNRDMKRQQLQEKTLILIDKKQIEGRGAFTTVVKGFDLMNRTLFAVKLFSDLSSPKIKALKRGEIKNLMILRWYFNFCKLEENLHGLIMKNIEGNTALKEIYRLDAQVSIDDIRANYCTQKNELSFNIQFDMILKLAEQLDKVHTQYKLLHRDLKPANIKVSIKDGKVLKVKIIDFGSAIPIETCTSEKSITGTDPYIHPALWYLKDLQELGYEKAIDNLANYGIYTDLYAFAVICGEILTKMGENPSKNLLQQRMPKIQALMVDVIKTESLLFSSEENLHSAMMKLHKHLLERYFLAGVLDSMFDFENSEKNFQQSIRIERRKAQDEKPMILTNKIQEFMPDVFRLDRLRIQEERTESYTDFENCLQNFILYELKRMANKLLAIQPEDNCQSLLCEEAKRLRKMKEDYEMLSKDIKQLLDAPTNLETTVNKMYESSNGSNFFQSKEKFKISKSTHSKFQKAQMHLISGSIDKFKEIHARKEEKSELGLKQASL